MDIDGPPSSNKSGSVFATAQLEVRHHDVAGTSPEGPGLGLTSGEAICAVKFASCSRSWRGMEPRPLLPSPTVELLTPGGRRHYPLAQTVLLFHAQRADTRKSPDL